MTTALMLRRRWAVEDPLLDCCIMIMDINNDREYWEQYQARQDEDDAERLYWPEDSEAAMFFLWDAAHHLERAGKKGYVWVDEGFMQAAEALTSLGNILMHEQKVLKLLKGAR